MTRIDHSLRRLVEVLPSEIESLFMLTLVWSTSAMESVPVKAVAGSKFLYVDRPCTIEHREELYYDSVEEMLNSLQYWNEFKRSGL